jgi:hypothetical protein
LDLGRARKLHFKVKKAVLSCYSAKGESPALRETPTEGRGGTQRGTERPWRRRMFRG